MIRQAISCDICGTEKRQTNHWFVAWESEGELRITGWTARTRLRATAKHLCGQACLHKLADDFMERIIARSARPDPAASADHSAQRSDASLTAPTDADSSESSARLIQIPSANSDIAAKVHRPPSDENAEPHYASRRWQAEAWQRERERTRNAS